MNGAPFFSPSRWEDEYRWHGDMLADTVRNNAYAEAIEIWVTNAAAAAQEGKISGDQLAPPVVLEIGTGSGLLSSLLMQAIEKHWPATLPPPEVFAVEVVPTLHQMAQKTLSRLSPPPAAQLTLLPRMHSLELPAELLPSRGLSLVLGELLDTGMLGEGLVASMRDAKKRLTASGGYEALPARGRVFASPCEGHLIHRLGGLLDDNENEASAGFRNRSQDGSASLDPSRNRERENIQNIPSFHAPRACGCCPGSAAAEGMHVWWGSNAELECGALPGTLGSLAQRPELLRRWGGHDSHGGVRNGESLDESDEIWPLVPPQEVLDMDFSDPPLSGRREVVFMCAKAGTVHGIVYWWRVDMLSRNVLHGAAIPHATDGSESVNGTSTASNNSGCVQGDSRAAKDGKDGPFMSTAPGDTAAPDHWRQNVVPLPQPITVDAGSKLVMTACHDADMIWFEGLQVFPATNHAEGIVEVIDGCNNITNTGSSENGCSYNDSSSRTGSYGGPPICSCGLHATHSRLRLAALNSPQRRRVLAGVADRAAAVWALQTGDQKQETLQQWELSKSVQEMQQSNGVESEEGARRDESEGNGESKTEELPSCSTGLALVLGDGPLLPFLLAARGFRVLVADRIGQKQQSDQGCDSDSASPSGVRRWITERCLEEAGLGGRVTFTDAGEEEDRDSDVEADIDGDVGGVATALRRAVARELMRMRRSIHSSLDYATQSRSNVVGLAGVFSEPFFPVLDEPGSDGDGWGFDSFLLLCNALHAFPRRDDQYNDSNISTGSGNLNSGDEIANKLFPQTKRQKMENDQNGTTISSISKIGSSLSQATQALCPLVVSPARAVIRGAFVKCRALWDSLRPLKPEDLEGLSNLSPAFDYSAKDQNVSGEGQAEANAQEFNDATKEHYGPFLRQQAATANVAIDALPFYLAQWPAAEVVTKPVDLLSIDLRARLSPHTTGRNNTQDCGKEVLEHTSRLRYNGISSYSTDDVGAKPEDSRSGCEESEMEAHALAVWIDYDLGPDTLDAMNLRNESNEGARWLFHGPGVWHGRQGVLALTVPLAFTEGATVELRTCLDASGKLTVDLA